MGRSAAEGIGYLLHYSWAFLVAQLVKKSTVRETWVRSLGWEDPLEKGKATHSGILAWRVPRIVYSPWGRTESDTTERLSLTGVRLFETPWTIQSMKFSRPEYRSG